MKLSMSSPSKETRRAIRYGCPPVTDSALVNDPREKKVVLLLFFFSFPLLVDGRVLKKGVGEMTLFHHCFRFCSLSLLKQQFSPFGRPSRTNLTPPGELLMSFVTSEATGSRSSKTRYRFVANFLSFHSLPVSAFTSNNNRPETTTTTLAERKKKRP